MVSSRLSLQASVVKENVRHLQSGPCHEGHGDGDDGGFKSQPGRIRLSHRDPN